LNKSFSNDSKSFQTQLPEWTNDNNNNNDNLVAIINNLISRYESNIKSQLPPIIEEQDIKKRKRT
jgi:hypothetical protein